MSVKRGLATVAAAVIVSALVFVAYDTYAKSSSKQRIRTKPEQTGPTAKVDGDLTTAPVTSSPLSNDETGKQQERNMELVRSLLSAGPDGDGHIHQRSESMACGPMNRSLEDLPADFDSKAFCQRFGEEPLSQPARVFYGVMFSFELDMLEVLLHETFPVVDKYIVVESRVSHSKKEKDLYLPLVYEQRRFAPFLSKIVTGTFNVRRSYRSGWDYEKRQRKRVLQVAQSAGIADGDVFVANLDLDEVFSRATVMRYKFCQTIDEPKYFHSFGFRYNINCAMDNSTVIFKQNVFVWRPSKVTLYDLYKRRNIRDLSPVMDMSNFAEEVRRREGRLVWHMSTFGTFDQIRFKLANSPHRFVDNVTDDHIKHTIQECEFNGRKRWKVKMLPDTVPILMRRNWCRFAAAGWLSQPDSGEVS